MLLNFFKKYKLTFDNSKKDHLQNQNLTRTGSFMHKQSSATEVSIKRLN